MKKKLYVLLSAVIAIACLVAVFVLFADCFHNGAGENPARGNGFEAMFAPKDTMFESYHVVPTMVAAFVLICVSFVTSWAAAIMFGKISSGIYLGTAVLLVIAAIFWLTCKGAYVKANADIGWSVLEDKFSIGAAPIVSSVFCFIGALAALFGAYKSWKE